MSEKSVGSNGESVQIESVIEALETAPDKNEILQALKDLRRDKVKKALGDTVKAAQFDHVQTLSDFLNDGEKVRENSTNLSERGSAVFILARTRRPARAPGNQGRCESIQTVSPRAVCGKLREADPGVAFIALYLSRG